jgi:EmrB/QacA subfamily drug resistance transporter
VRTILNRLHNQKVAVSVVFVAAMFVNLLDITIVNVALPKIASGFEVSVASTATISVGYLVSLAVFIPVSGWLGDRFGGKRVLLFALAVFTGASALCGFATSLGELVFFRVLQGVGGGLLTPVGMAMLYRTFPPAERMRASKILTVPTTLAPALGPVLGGVLVDSLSWRWIFFVNVPIGIAAFAFGLVFLGEQLQHEPGRFDLAGFLLAAAGFSGVMYALSEGSGHGWTSPEIVASGLLGLALVAALVVVELRAPQPMLNFRLYGNRLFRTGNAITLISSAGFLGSLYLFPLLLQDGMHLSALESGLNTFPEAFGVMVAAQIISRVYHYVGPRRLIAGGAIAVPAIITYLGTVGPDSNMWVVRVAMFGLGFCMAHIFMPTQTAAFATISSADTGRGSTLYNAVRQLGSALGIAVLGTVLAGVGTSKPSGAPNLAAYHTGFFVAAGLVLTAVVFALLVRDREAASTMVRPVRRGQQAVPSSRGAVAADAPEGPSDRGTVVANAPAASADAGIAQPDVGPADQPVVPVGEPA